MKFVCMYKNICTYHARAKTYDKNHKADFVVCQSGLELVEFENSSELKCNNT
jgi:hypothetical protein